MPIGDMASNSSFMGLAHMRSSPVRVYGVVPSPVIPARSRMEVPELPRYMGSAQGAGCPANPVTRTKSPPVWSIFAPRQDNASRVNPRSWESRRFRIRDVPLHNAAQMSMRWEMLLEPGTVTIRGEETGFGVNCFMVGPVLVLNGLNILMGENGMPHFYHIRRNTGPQFKLGCCLGYKHGHPIYHLASLFSGH